MPNGDSVDLDSGIALSSATLIHRSNSRNGALPSKVVSFSFAIEEFTSYQVPTPLALPLGLKVASNGIIRASRQQVLTFGPTSKTKEINEYPPSPPSRASAILSGHPRRVSRLHTSPSSFGRESQDQHAHPQDRYLPTN
ncbi:hypothetical protein BKA65DRAFT_291006 [Rhexocercosporidium sp. MPI-PUGE-AT-0058]|nr:hypothetical protein BKA65DRAFT_291006 [Rhexocercosporidium sp. MPI-PUGE-AT-0058]